MERGQIIFVAVVVAVLSLFGLKVWSDRTAASTLEAESRGATERLARAGGLHGASESWSQPGSGGDDGYSRPGGPLRAGGPSGSSGAGAGRVAGGGPDGRGSGPAGSPRGGGSTAGGALGGSGSNRLPGGWGGVSGAGAPLAGGSGTGGNHGGPNGTQKQNLVDFLSAQPPTQANLNASAKNPDGSDVALKIDKLDDINSQGGHEQDVQQSEDGDGIQVGAAGDMTFPNNVSPDAATISFQFTPNWAGSDQSDNALLELRGENDWSNRIELVKNGDFLRFIVTPNSGQESDISYNISSWQAGEPHQITASYGNGTTTLMADGQTLGTNQYVGQLQIADNIPLHLGGAPPGSTYIGANGVFSGVSIINPNK